MFGRDGSPGSGPPGEGILLYRLLSALCFPLDGETPSPLVSWRAPIGHSIPVQVGPPGFYFLLAQDFPKEHFMRPTLLAPLAHILLAGERLTAHTALIEPACVGGILRGDHFFK